MMEDGDVMEDGGWGRWCKDKYFSTESMERCRLGDMPGQLRLDALGALQDVTGRGISIFRSDEEREDFLSRLGFLCEGALLSVYGAIYLHLHQR